MFILGDLFAILAAASNGTIGVFNRYGFSSRASYTSLSFFKCLGAFLIVSFLLGFRPQIRADMLARRKDGWKIAVLSFFGIFILYFFETLAFSLTSIPVVSFLTYAGGVVAIVLGIVFLKERISVAKALSLILVFWGVFQMFGGLRQWQGELDGAFFAIIGGIGYSTFLFLWKKFSLPSGLGTLWWFFGFGSLFLAIPFVLAGAHIPEKETWLSILALFVVPTLGGYYFTSRALALTEASRVQIIETTDPLFSSLFAFFLFHDVLSTKGLFGALAIFFGVVILAFPSRSKKVPLS